MSDGPLTLPYHFDSSFIVARILRMVLGFVALVVVPGAIFTLVVRHNTAGAAVFAVIGILMLVFARIVAVQLAAATGVVTQSEVILRPYRVFGMKMGLSARIPLDRFEAVRVERMSARVDTPQSGPHERVLLVGRSGTPDVLLAQTNDGEGVTVGRQLAAAIARPYNEVDAPY